jgi:hypothetical protein
MADQTPIDENQRRREEYEKHREQAWKDINASSDEFDKNLLTFSSGILGLSLAFIKDIVHLQNAVALPCLYLSWILLTLCILTTIFSYRFSYWAQLRHLNNLREYYLEGKESALDRETFWSKAVDFCALSGAILFFAGVVTTVFFVSLNVAKEHRMPDPKVQKAATAIVPNVQSPVIVERGRGPMPMTPVQSQSSGSATPSQSQSVPVVVTPMKKV